MLNLIKHRGQSTIEYVIILTALAVAFIAGTVAVRNALYTGKGDEATGLIAQSGNMITDWTDKLPKE